MIQQIIGSVVEVLIVEGTSVAPYYNHGPKGWNNLIEDEIEGTVVTLVEPLISNDVIVGGLLKEAYPILLLFTEKTEIDASPQEELVLNDRMRRLRAKFLFQLLNNELVDDIENIVTRDAYKQKDKGVSGVSLEFNITLKQAQPLC
jgi:hypothetical protein